MQTKPKIQLSLSTFDKVLEWLAVFLLIVLWGLALWALATLPAIIPTHFTFSGEVDGYGTKWTIMILPVVATIVYAGVTKINLFPHVFNYMVPITEKNAPSQYTRSTRVLRFVKLVILILFSFLVILTMIKSKA